MTRKRRKGFTLWGKTLLISSDGGNRLRTPTVGEKKGRECGPSGHGGKLRRRVYGESAIIILSKGLALHAVEKIGSKKRGGGCREKRGEVQHEGFISRRPCRRPLSRGEKKREGTHCLWGRETNSFSPHGGCCLLGGNGKE